ETDLHSAARQFIETNCVLGEFSGVRLQRGSQDVDHVTAMHAHHDRAVYLPVSGVADFVEDIARVPCTAEALSRNGAGGEELVIQTHVLDDGHDVGSKADARTDTSELRGLLVDFHGKSSALEEHRSRSAA